MKRNIYLYLFLFTALIALFLFVRGQNLTSGQSASIDRLQEENGQLRDSLKQAKIDLLDMQYFSLENNDDALAYYDHLEIANPSRYIADKLLETNEEKGDNPLIPYEGMDSDFKINKIKLLNHKWIVADFSDGKYWGELLIRYRLKDDKAVEFEMIDHLLYTRSQ